MLVLKKYSHERVPPRSWWWFINVYSSHDYSSCFVLALLADLSTVKLVPTSCTMWTHIHMQRIYEYLWSFLMWFKAITRIAIVYNYLAYIRVLQYHVHFDENVIIISNTYTALLHVQSCCPSDFEGFCIYKAQKKEQDGSNDAWCLQNDSGTSRFFLRCLRPQ